MNEDPKSFKSLNGDSRESNPRLEDANVGMVRLQR